MGRVSRLVRRVINSAMERLKVPAGWKHIPTEGFWEVYQNPEKTVGVMVGKRRKPYVYRVNFWQEKSYEIVRGKLVEDPYFRPKFVESETFSDAKSAFLHALHLESVSAKPKKPNYNPNSIVI